MYPWLRLTGGEPHFGWQGRYIWRWGDNGDNFSWLPSRPAGALLSLWPLLNTAAHTDHDCQHQEWYGPETPLHCHDTPPSALMIAPPRTCQLLRYSASRVCLQLFHIPNDPNDSLGMVHSHKGEHVRPALTRRSPRTVAQLLLPRPSRWPHAIRDPPAFQNRLSRGLPPVATPAALSYPMLRRLSRPRYTALRLAAGRSGGAAAARTFASSGLSVSGAAWQAIQASVLGKPATPDWAVRRRLGCKWMPRPRRNPYLAAAWCHCASLG